MSSRAYLVLENSLQGLKEEYKVMQDSFNNKLQLEKEFRDASQNELQVTKVKIFFSLLVFSFC